MKQLCLQTRITWFNETIEYPNINYWFNGTIGYPNVNYLVLRYNWISKHKLPGLMEQLDLQT